MREDEAELSGSRVTKLTPIDYRIHISGGLSQMLH